MVKRNGSLAGKGLEILYGKSAEETPPATGETASKETTEGIAPEWAADLEAEATAVNVQPAEDLFGSGAPISPDEDRPAAPEPETDMMLLATTPVVEQVSEKPLPSLATTPIGEETTLPVMPQPAATQPPIQPPPVEQPYAQPAAAQPHIQPPAVEQPYTQPAAAQPHIQPPAVEQPYTQPQAPQPTTTYVPPVTAYTPPVRPTTAEPTAAPLPVETRVSTPKVVLGEPLYVTAPRITAEQLEAEVGIGFGELPPEKLVDAEINQPSRIREEAEVLEAIPPKERAELWKEINVLYERVAQELATHRDQQPALALLREAQDILLEKPRQFDEVKFKVGQVKTLLQRRKNVVTAIHSTAWWIFAYDIAWILVLFILVFFVDLNLKKPGTEALWNTLLWGGIGGVVGGFYGLYRHASELQDFDKNYSMWYVAQPIIGLLLGGAIHLILNAGFLAVNVEGTESTIQWLPAMLAFLSGFRQRFVLDLIASIVDRLSPPRSKSASEESK